MLVDIVQYPAMHGTFVRSASYHGNGDINECSLMLSSSRVFQRSTASAARKPANNVRPAHGVPVVDLISFLLIVWAWFACNVCDTF